MDALFSDYEDVRKSGLFDAAYYLATYPDVAARNVDPLVHYLEEGAAAGHNPGPDFDAEFYLEQCRQRGEAPGNPLLHYLRIGAARGLKPRRDAPATAKPPEPAAKAAAPAVKPPVLVAIERLGITGLPHGRTRLSVGGWALASGPIVDITVALDSEVRGSAFYGLASPDIARLYPDRAEAGHSGFVLSLELPAARSGLVTAMLRVRTADGQIGQQPLRFDIPPQRLGGGAERRPPAQVAIERASVDPGGLLEVEGWAVSLVQIKAVTVTLDGVRLGAAEFGRVRTDQQAALRDYPNARLSGFRLAADVGSRGAGRKRLVVRVLARDGVAAEAVAMVDIPAVAMPTRRADLALRHHCDEIALSPDGQLRLKGWLVAGAPVEAVRVRLDGVDVGDAELRLDRPEIGNLFPALPYARQSGFAFAAATDGLLRGSHVVTLEVRLVGGAVHQVQLPVAAGPAADVRGTMAVFDPGFMLNIDTPEPIDGAADIPVRGNLQISGWAVARDGVAAIEIAIDDVPIATADYGLRRLDIRAAFPDWEDSLTSGFTALIPHRVLPKGSRTVTVTLRDKLGGSTSTEFGIAVEELSARPGPWSLRRAMPPAEVDLYRRMIEATGRQPVFTAVLPLPDEAVLARAAVTVASLRAQAYANWRLLLVPPGRRRGRAGGKWDARLGELAAGDARIAAIAAPRVEAIEAADSASDEGFVALLSAGDELGVDALLEMALAAAMHPASDFLYSDERRPDPASGAIEAFFKPQWSPDLLLSTNYIGRLWCAHANLWRVAADLAGALAGSEYDLVLRLTEKAQAIHHVPAVLCERGAAAEDRDEKAAVAGALQRRGIVAEVSPGRAPGSHRIKRMVAQPGKVSIIIPTCAARGMIETCIATLRRLTAWPDYEIVCVENIPPADRKWRVWLRRNADHVISARGAFNWSRFNNLATAQASGRYLLFLNDDIEITDPDWLDVLVAEAERPEVGVVGPLLLYPDGRIQHAGMFLAAMGQGRHAFRHIAGDDPGYFGLAQTQRNVIAVTGACLLTRRETFDALGGFDEAHGIINNDVDYCLRAWRSGLVNVYTPHARLVHHEAASRVGLDDDYDVAAFSGEWRSLFLVGDPYFSPYLSKAKDDFAIDDEPTVLSVTGGPTLRRNEIRNILVVKLDHIGDCIIAFPAVRRLQRHFPQARITVLTSRVSRPVWAYEPVAAVTIEFDFFHPSSAMGEIEHTDEEWEALRRRLSAERFDLAVDLRKHPETRPVLRHTGARYLAGFDHRGEFTWLDVALDWPGDQIFARKRQWAGDDLVNLVDAIAAACEGDRGVIGGVAPTLQRQSNGAAGPVVWVHPTAGNDIKQWPLAYFAVVIDQLVEAHGARVFLTGAPADEPAAAAILAALRHPEAVTSMIGRSPLAELPRLLQGAALFLGNDSGLKHIAAGLGIPTVGVHGGTLDPREWGPVGPSAVALARDMVCSPCYLSNPADCRREVACLRQLDPAHVYEACRRLLLLGAGRLSRE